jgi:DNA-binding protein HU-beta
MNRAELVNFIANDMNISRTQADRFIATFTEAVYKNVRKEGVKIAGFGTFKATKRNARMGRNPQTGEEIKIPSRWVPVFKAGSSLKESVHGKKKQK